MLAVAGLRLGYLTYYRSAFPVHYSGLVAAASEQTGIPQQLLYAVIRTESGFVPEAQSSVGAREIGRAHV